MAETIILTAQNMTGFAAMAMYGGFHARGFNFGTGMDAFAITQGETYRVIWDDTEYEVVAKDGSLISPGTLYLGNASVFGLEGNNEPFLIPWQSSGVAFISLTETKDTHYVGISIATEETQNPYDIVLKTWDGSEVVHNAPNGIEVLLPDGNTQRYIPGEPEETTVALDFSTGDMEVVPSKGKLLTKVSIPRPINLLPTNIAKDVEIAGIVGTHEGGGNLDGAYISYTLDADGYTTTASMNGFSSIPYSCFRNHSRLETVDFSGSPNISAIGPYAFANCSKLSGVTLPNSVTSISYDAFYYCTSLKSITIPNSVTSIGSEAFKECRGLTHITIPGCIIKEYAFQNCTGLQSVIIEEGAPGIGDTNSSNFYSPFSGCTALKTITIPSTVKAIGWSGFYNCPLESAVFANPNGWYWTKTKGATSGTAVDMSDPATAATALKTNYNCYWYRK